MAATAKQKDNLYGGVPAADPSKYPHHDFYKVFNRLIFPLHDDRLMGTKQLGLLHLIARETIGKSRDVEKYPNAPLWCCLTRRAIAEVLYCTERFVSEMIADGCQRATKRRGAAFNGRGLFAVMTQAEARKAGFPHVSHANALWFCLTAENWAKAPQYEAKRPLEVPEEDEPEEDEPEPEAVAEQLAPRAVAAFPASSPVQTVEPDERTKRVRVDLHGFQLVNKSSVPLLVELKVDLENLVATVFEADPHRRNKSEVTLNCGSGTPGRKDGEATLNCSSGMSRKALIADLANRLSGKGLHCDSDLVGSLVSRLECPNGFFVEHVVSRRIARAARRRETITPSLLPGLAADANQIWPRVKAEWEALTAEDARHADSRRVHEAAAGARFLQMAREVMAHPEGRPASEIDWAQEILAAEAAKD